MYKLICKANPRTLGIEDTDGNWDMDKFKEHILSCQECYSATKLIENELVDANGDWNMELGCKKDPIELGLIDKEGNWDYVKLELHTEFCHECNKLYQKAEKFVKIILGIENKKEDNNKQWH